MDLIKIDIPYSHVERVRMGEIDYDYPHSIAGAQCYVLGYDQHEWLAKNSPNQFYALYTDTENASVVLDGIERIATILQHKLYTYRDVALLYKLTWF